MLRFAIAGLRGRAPIPASMARRLRPFAGGDGSVDVEFDVEARPGPLLASVRPRWVRRGGAVRTAGPLLSAAVAESGRGWRVRGRLRRRRIVWDSLLRAVWSWVLPERGGLLLHASGAVVGGRALIFPGPSGAGKSTLARKAGPARMLADDTLAVARRGGRWVACATPFYSRLPPPRPGQWPLRALLFPLKGGAAVEPVGPAEAARRLLRHVIWFSADGPASARVLELAADLAASVPAAVLGSFRADPFDRILERVDGCDRLG